MFSDLALQKLLQLFPELSAYIINFKDITDEANKGDNSDVSIGSFILRFGTEYYYVPVLAKGEIVQPIDSIFDVTNGIFKPLTKGFVQKAINSSQLDLGKPTKVPSTVTKNPSVYSLVTPPRTGKFVYASSSRLTEFLSIMPNMVKRAVLENLTADKEVYQSLHKLFGLEALLGALRPVESPVKVVDKPAVEVITEGRGLDNAAVRDILEKGYSLRGENTTNRVAVLANNFDKTGVLRNLGMADAGYDYEIVMSNGEIADAFIPKRAKTAPVFAALLDRDRISQEPVFAIFSNGDFILTPGVVARGNGGEGFQTFKKLFAFESPVNPKDVTRHDLFAIFSPDMEFIGAYDANSVQLSNFGVTITARPLIRSQTLTTNGWGIADRLEQVTINAYRNCVKVDASNPTNIFVPYNAVVVRLHQNRSSDVEVNVNTALAKLELSTLETLGSAADIGFDGVEFSWNGRPVGSEVNMIKVLVIDQGIQPEKAESFIKQAKETKKVKIYLSKKADFEPGEIPQFGDAPAEQVDPWDLQNGLGTNFTGKVKDAVGTGDPQTVESTILSELLQVTNMKEYIREYLPEIEQAIDKLGRTLFLSRLNINELSGSHNSTELISFISNLRNVYRLLGDNYIKLEQMTAGAETEDQVGIGN